MKRLFTILAAVLLIATMWAQNPPQKMSYQAVIRDLSNHLVTTQIGMQISILQVSESGTAVYIETQTPTPNINGLVTIKIGEGTKVSTGTFAEIDWSAGPYFIKTETATEAPLTTYTITGISQLLSVPYALYAKTSEKANELELKLQKLSNTMIAGGMVTDFDGNTYNTVKIGTQVWLTENLAVTHYRNSDPIPIITDYDTWQGLTTGAYCHYNNEPANSTIYGCLYNYYSVIDSRNLCPTGWHVPTFTDWSTLTSYLGGTNVAGGKMKEVGTSHWINNVGATNASGFSALPAGYRPTGPGGGAFITLGTESTWWCSSEVWYLCIYNYLEITSGASNIYGTFGYSVRCLKD